MANLFNSKTNIFLATIGLSILVTTTFLLLDKSAVEPAAVVSQEEVATRDFYQEAIDRRERMLAAKEEADELEKRRITKEKTVECRFWKQQQSLGKSDKTDRKVLEHCTVDYIAPEGDSLEDNQ